MALSNRSLSRGLSILNCFRAGLGALTHADISERTGLPKATVTRLLETLVHQGYLAADPARRGYRLGVPLLSLSFAMRFDDPVLQAVAPVLRKVAEEQQALVAFGAVHDADIVCIDAANGDRRRGDRQIGPGMRAPLLGTALGRAWLAGLEGEERERIVARLERATGQSATQLRRELAAVRRELRQEGFVALLLPTGQYASIAAPVRAGGRALYAFSVVSASGRASEAGVVPGHMVQALAELVASVG